MSLFKKDINDFLKKLKKSVVHDTENHEQMSKLQDNGNEKRMAEDTGDDLDDYEKYILDLVIGQEKRTSVIHAELKYKQTNEKDQEVRLQTVSKVTVSCQSELKHKRQTITVASVSADDAHKERLIQWLRETEQDLESTQNEVRDP